MYCCIFANINEGLWTDFISELYHLFTQYIYLISIVFCLVLTQSKEFLRTNAPNTNTELLLLGVNSTFDNNHNQRTPKSTK